MPAFWPYRTFDEFVDVCVYETRHSTPVWHRDRGSSSSRKRLGRPRGPMKVSLPHCDRSHVNFLIDQSMGHGGELQRRRT